MDLIEAKKQKLKIEKEIIQRQIQIEDFARFSKRAILIIEPALKLKWNWHHQLICESLQALHQGKAPKNLLINVAPRSLKSILITILYPAWCWLHDNSKNFINLSYAANLANDHAQKRRTLIESDYYQNLADFIGGITLSDSKNRITEYENTQGRGTMFARGLGGAVTGIGGDYLLFDDPNNPASEGETNIVREAMITYFKDYSSTRLNNPKTGHIILIQQRTHQLDCTGSTLEMLKKDKELAKDWQILILETKATKTQKFTFPISGDTKTIRTGEYLHPERHAAKEDRAARTTLGSRTYAARHLQKPVAGEGNIFEFDWLSNIDVLPRNFEIALSIDTSFGSKTAGASYTVIGCYLLAEPNIILFDQRRGKWSYPEMKRVLQQATTVWEEQLDQAVNYRLIEAKASGSPIYQELATTTSTGWYPINPTTDKVTRAYAIAPFVEAGNFGIYEKFVNRNLFTTEITTFPFAANDDQTDTLTQLVWWATTRWGRAKRQRERMGAINTQSFRM